MHLLVQTFFRSIGRSEELSKAANHAAQKAMTHLGIEYSPDPIKGAMNIGIPIVGDCDAGGISDRAGGTRCQHAARKVKWRLRLEATGLDGYGGGS